MRSTNGGPYPLWSPRTSYMVTEVKDQFGDRWWIVTHKEHLELLLEYQINKLNNLDTAQFTLMKFIYSMQYDAVHGFKIILIGSSTCCNICNGGYNCTCVGPEYDWWKYDWWKYDWWKYDWWKYDWWKYDCIDGW